MTLKHHQHQESEFDPKTYVQWSQSQDPASLAEPTRLSTLETLAVCAPSQQLASELNRWTTALRWEERPLWYASIYPNLRPALMSMLHPSIARDGLFFKFELMTALHQEMSTSVTVFNQHAPLYGDTPQRPLHDVLLKWNTCFDGAGLLDIKNMVEAVVPKPTQARPHNAVQNKEQAAVAAQWDLYTQSIFTTMNQAISEPKSAVFDASIPLLPLPLAPCIQ